MEEILLSRLWPSNIPIPSLGLGLFVFFQKMSLTLNPKSAIVHNYKPDLLLLAALHVFVFVFVL